MDGDGLALTLHLLDQLLEQSIVFGVTDAQATPLLPEKELLGAGQHGVLEVELEGTAVRIPVGDGVHDGIAWEAVSVVLDDVAKVEGFVVGKVTAI